jgi:hypothetical protein
MKKNVLLISEPVFFSTTTKEMLGLIEPTPKNFLEFPLPSRMSSLEIQTATNHSEFVSYDGFLYLISKLPELNKEEHYLVLHFSQNREKATSYIFWDDKNWHITTEVFNSQIRCKWNSGIIYLYIKNKIK